MADSQTVASCPRCNTAMQLNNSAHLCGDWPVNSYAAPPAIPPSLVRELVEAAEAAAPLLRYIAGPDPETSDTHAVAGHERTLRAAAAAIRPYLSEGEH